MGETGQPVSSGGDVRVRKRFPFALLLFGLMAVVSVAFGFLTNSVNQARVLVQAFGYYAIAGTFLWAVVALIAVAPEWWRSLPRFSRREMVTVVAVIAALTLVAVWTVPYSYKVLYDEFVLQATAWSMHENREVGAIVRGYDIGGVFTTLQTYLDKRPMFFTFLVSLLHDLTGYREGNAFALNTALMPAILGLVYVFARRLADHASALAAVIGLGAFSLLAHNATGAGMEMLNFAMLLVVMHAAALYLDAPDEPRLSALVLAVVLLAQTRYESSLYVGPAAVVVLEGWRRAGRLILPAAAIMGPALLIPYALHNTYLSGTPLLWELREGQEARFGFVHLADNLKHAALFFFNVSGNMMNSWWLPLAGLPALGWGLWLAARNWRRWKAASGSLVALGVFGSAIVVNLGLLMFYYWGQLDDPIVSRLSLPFYALLAFALAWALSALPARWHRRGVAMAVGGALACYVITGLPANASHWELNLQAREIAWEYNWVKNLSPEKRLIVTNKSALNWLSSQISAVQLTAARLRAAGIKFHLDHHTFKEVLVMQTYRAVGAEGGYQLDPADRLPESFVLEPVVEKRFGLRLARISRIKAIKLDDKVSPEGTETIAPRNE